jgi:hypothetical protein
MIQVLGENYFIDLDEIEKYLDMSQVNDSEESESGVTDTKINIIKYEMVKLLLDTVLTEQEIVDEKLGMKSNSNVSIPFKIAFNSLLNKKLINHY